MVARQDLLFYYLERQRVLQASQIPLFAKHALKQYVSRHAPRKICRMRMTGLLKGQKMPKTPLMKPKSQLPLKIQQDAILAGMEEGIDRILRYSHSIKDTKPEYLLTISIADKLSDLNVTPYDARKIEVEKPTSQVTDAIIINFFHLLQCYRRKSPPADLKVLEKLKRYERKSRHLLNWRRGIIKKSAVLRKGKVDIFVSVDIAANTPAEHLMVVEVKREWPEILQKNSEDTKYHKREIQRSRSRRASFEREIKKDIKRLEEFIVCSQYSKSDLTGHLTFFTLKKESCKNIKKQFCSKLDQQISVTVKNKYTEGNPLQFDDIDDSGEPLYYVDGIPHFYIYCISLKLKRTSKFRK